MCISRINSVDTVECRWGIKYETFKSSISLYREMVEDRKIGDDLSNNDIADDLE